MGGASGFIKVMLKRAMIILGVGPGLVLLAATGLEAGQATPQSGMPVAAQQALVDQYCADCHNDALRAGGFSWADIDLAHPERSAARVEQVIRKLGIGLMPPVGSRRPDSEAARSFVSTLAASMDAEAALRPNPGSRGFQRLTRTEYARSVRDLFGIELDVAAVLPPDSLSGDGFDNLADAQGFSATLTEGYLRAAREVTRAALGDPKATPASEVFQVSRNAAQMERVEGAPAGTRGGISVTYNFPADGNYSIRSMLYPDSVGGVLGSTIEGEQLEVSIDGYPVALYDIDQSMHERDPAGMNLAPVRVFVKAGPHRVTSAFIASHSGLLDDHITPLENTQANMDSGLTGMITVWAHLRELEISGPLNVTGVSDFEGRRRVFLCRPLDPSEELPCATRIIGDLAGRAFRRPVTSEDLEGLMTFFDRGREAGDFESGIHMATQAILVSPDFVFRFEQLPATAVPDEIYPVGDFELASRLSFFLWSRGPDDALLRMAAEGKLKDPVVLEAEVRRMLKDPRSESLAMKFGSQWLHLDELDAMTPNLSHYPEWDLTLTEAMKREVELFFDSIVREDRNVLDLVTASDTFVNGRLARHYGLGRVFGTDFQRVEMPEDYRRGLLGKGAILTLTSLADRTSPVYRGKWVMVVLFGTPPPPPPPAVPLLEETSGVSAGRVLTVRERMELHRANPACTSCHQLIDPIGLALENFDVTGIWRTMDKTASYNEKNIRVRSPGIPIDTKTQLFDGTPLDGPASLRAAILDHSDAVIQNLTEKLMAYALGRRIEHFDMPVVRAIARGAAENDNRFSSLALGIVNSQAFRMSQFEAATADQQEQ